MKVKTKHYDVGVIVGRFQVPELHEGHKQLIETVMDRHDKVLIFLGLSPLKCTKENPLDFESRKQMLLDVFPKANILYIKDQYSDEVWSKRLDEHIGDLVTPNQSVVLYGSRDSFVSHYKGKYETLELMPEVVFSGSEMRKRVHTRSVKGTHDFRAGVVWASANKFPTVYTTVDVAIFNEDCSKILLGRKANEDKYRLIGGFADPKSYTFEQDARREVMEEAGIEISNPKYINSHMIDDWRYRSEEDCIKTLLFVAKYTFGSPKAADDIAEVRWFEVGTLATQRQDIIMPLHKALVRDALHFALFTTF